MKNFLCLFLLFTSILLTAQDHPTCDGARYRTNVFTDVQSTKGLKYGAGTTINGSQKELFLDVYEPVGDVAENRPVIILAFGGSFILGNRNDIEELCKDFAQKGFVAVTIDYRLYDLPIFPLPTAAEMKEVVVKSVSDMKAAIRFMREDAHTDNEFRIDPDLVFIGGISAGGIVAAHTAVMDSTDAIAPDVLALIQANGGFDGNTSDNHQYSSEVQGLVNFSGGLNDASWIDANDPPFVSVHDELDGTVPYGAGYASILGLNIIYLEGSQIIQLAGDSVGVANSLRTIEGSNGHVSYFNSANVSEEVLSFTGGFLHDLICGPISAIQSLDEKLVGVTIYPNPTAGVLYIKRDQAFSSHLTLFNAIGQQISHWENAYSIDLSPLQTGVYFLKIEDGKSNASVMKKVLVNR